MFDELLDLVSSTAERQPRAPRHRWYEVDHDEVAFRERHGEPPWTPELVRGLAPIAGTLLDATRPQSIVRNAA